MSQVYRFNYTHSYTYYLHFYSFIAALVTVSYIYSNLINLCHFSCKHFKTVDILILLHSSAWYKRHFCTSFIMATVQHFFDVTPNIHETGVSFRYHCMYRIQLQKDHLLKGFENIIIIRRYYCWAEKLMLHRNWAS